MVSAALHATFRVIPLCGPDGSVGGCVEPSDIGLYPPPQLPNGGGAESPDPWGGGPGGILPLPNEGGGGGSAGGSSGSVELPTIDGAGVEDVEEVVATMEIEAPTCSITTTDDLLS